MPMSIGSVYLQHTSVTLHCPLSFITCLPSPHESEGVRAPTGAVVHTPLRFSPHFFASWLTANEQQTWYVLQADLSESCSLPSPHMFVPLPADDVHMPFPSPHVVTKLLFF